MTTSRSEPVAFGRTTTTDEVLAGVDLGDKLAIVTGASSGLGQELAGALRSAGAEVVAAVRDPSAVDGTSVQLDLGSLDSVRAAADVLASRRQPIDLLFNNAGVMATPQAVTADGFELQLGTNHLGHFLFTALLAPSLSHDARVINTSSLGHMITGMDWDDPHFRTRHYDKWQAYGQSKTANILFAKALAGRGYSAHAVHPGAIDTGLTRHLEGDELAFVAESGASEAKTPQQGAATLAWAAVAEQIPSGSYLADCQLAEPAPHAADPSEAERLWTWSEEQVGFRFETPART